MQRYRWKFNQGNAAGEFLVKSKQFARRRKQLNIIRNKSNEVIIEDGRVVLRWKEYVEDLYSG